MFKFLLLSWVLVVSTVAQAEPLPVEYFANMPDVRQLRLSPSGNKIASVTRFDVKDTQGTAIQVTDAKAGKSKMVLFSDDTKYFIGSMWWKDDVTLLVNTWFPADRDTWVDFTQVRYDTREWRLLIIDTVNDTVSSPFKKSFLRKYKILPSNLGTVIDSLPDDSDHILMSIPSRTRNFSSYPMVIKVNIHNQDMKVVQKPEDNVYEWSTDQFGRIRASVWYKDGTSVIRVKPVGSKKWKELWKFENFEKDMVNIIGFGDNPNEVYITAFHNNYNAIYKVDITKKELPKELVYENPEYDVFGSVMYSEKDKRVLGIATGGVGSDDGVIFFDSKFKDLQAKINRALPNTSNRITSFNKDESRFLVFSSGPKESGTYYLGEFDPVKLKAVSYRYSKLPPDVLADVREFKYKARDGVGIEAFLTLPNGVKPKNLPTIVFPHGGPISFDANDFDYWAQFYANRGYAVLQMNFRGSAGHGMEFVKSGLQQWGKKMQDDIEDGAKALIKEGIANPDKICIAGGSYGGYAALMGVVKTPDRYQCAISVNGVSNVFDLVRDKRRSWANYNVIDEMIGFDHSNLHAISPVNHVKEITVPVLLIHGTLDRQVDVKHSQQMFEAMKAANKQVEYIELPGEDHYLANEAMRLKAFKAMDEFLAKVMPAH